MSDSDNEGLIDAVDALLPALLQALEALGFIARHLHPPLIGELTEQMGPVEARRCDAGRSTGRGRDARGNRRSSFRQ